MLKTANIYPYLVITLWFISCETPNPVKYMGEGSFTRYLSYIDVGDAHLSVLN